MRNCFRFFIYLVVFTVFESAVASDVDDFFIDVLRDRGHAVSSLLKRGFDPNTRDPNGQTGLILALRGQSLKAADALLQAPDLDVNVANVAGETALMMAVLRGNIEQARRLLARGAKVNVEEPGWSPLHYAASGQGTELLRLLLDSGAAIDAESPNGSTPLMMASRYGSEASVDLLLARGADNTWRNEQGLSAADFARLGGRDSLAGKLTSLGKR